MTLRAGDAAEYIGALSGQKVSVNGGNIVVNIKANGGDIWLPLTDANEKAAAPVAPVTSEAVKAAGTAVEKTAEKQPESAGTDHQNNQITQDAAQSEAQNAQAAAQPSTAEQPADTASASTKAAESTAAGQGSSQNAGKASKEFDAGKIAGLQEAILAIMEKNGPVTDQMRRDVEANVYHDSLITWIKSFR